MAREIKGTLYKIHGFTSSRFVECENLNDLYRHIAEEYVLKGYPVSVVEVCADGTTPRVKVLSDKNFKRILRETQQAIANGYYTKEGK